MAAKKDTDYKCELSSELLQKAKEELNEDPSTRMIEVKTLRARLEKTPGLIPRTDTKFLLMFLRGRKFDQEKTYKLVKNYYKVRCDDPEVFSFLKPSAVRHVWDDGVLEPLEHRDKDGCQVVVFRAGRFDIERYSMLDVVRLTYLVYRKLIENEETQVNGVRILLDLSELTWKTALSLTPTNAKRFLQVVQDLLPMRMKSVLFIKESHVIDIIFPLYKLVSKDKILKRTVKIGDKLEKIHEFIKPEYLPTDLGGELPPFNNKAWNEAFLASDADFEEDGKFGFVNMSVNPAEKPSKSGDAAMSGLGGTFKKLSL